MRREKGWPTPSMSVASDMTAAVYFDGQIAADQPVTATIGADALRFEGPQTPVQSWTYSELSAIERHHAGHAFRITHAGQPGARLVLRDDAFTAELLGRAPHLKGGLSLRGAGRIAAWVAGVLLAVMAAGYLVLQLAPQKLAFVLPDSWRERVGAQVETSLTGGAKLCTGEAGMAAVSAMTARLTEGTPDLPPLSIRVYDVPVMNAFAMPGERIVITAELIRRAARPEQVAGVLAHELGHVAMRHSEAQLVRVTGLQILVSIVTGGGSDTIGSMAGLAAILSYSREAEAEADDFAIAAMTASAIDTTGLREFFELILKEEGKPSTGPFSKIGSVLNTHPGTEDRIKKIHPLPDGTVARPVMTDDQWQALKRICG
jgi:beta-barrel assembly-enhancing protease